MSKKLPLILIVGGLLVGGITWLGYTTVNKKSSDQVLLESMAEMRANERNEAEKRRELMDMVLVAPASCEGLNTKFLFDYMEYEPDPGGDWPDWTNLASQAEQSCILDAFHQTNVHAFKIQGKDYKKAAPGTNRVANFMSDVSRASLFTDGVNYGDPDASLEMLVNGYYADRATSAVAPGHDY